MSLGYTAKTKVKKDIIEEYVQQKVSWFKIANSIFSSKSENENCHKQKSRLSVHGKNLTKIIFPKSNHRLSW
jgi:hypothetical protein